MIIKLVVVVAIIVDDFVFSESEIYDVTNMAVAGRRMS